MPTRVNERTAGLPGDGRKQSGRLAFRQREYGCRGTQSTQAAAGQEAAVPGKDDGLVTRLAGDEFREGKGSKGAVRPRVEEGDDG